MNMYKFGQNLGICFQLIDDLIDYTSNEKDLGKKAMADLQENNINEA